MSTTAEMLRRAEEDVDYARAVLQGTEGNEEVRAAILAYIAAEGGDPEVVGHAYGGPALPTSIIPPAGTSYTSSAQLSSFQWGISQLNMGAPGGPSLGTTEIDNSANNINPK